MAFKLNKLAQLASQGINVQPSLVLQIKGVPTLYGIGIIKKYIRIGDNGLFVGTDWVIGGFNEVEDQSDLISLDGTTTTISQQMLQDKGGTSSVSSMIISLIDKDEEITRLITPGVVVDDLLGSSCKIWLGFQDTAFPQDYVNIFSGIIDDIDASGNIKLNVAHPEGKKRQELLQSVKSSLVAAIGPSDTTIIIDKTSGAIEQPQDAMSVYLKIDDEIIKAGNVSTQMDGIHLTSCLRAQNGTVAASHDIEASAESIYRITGYAFDLALKLMLSQADGLSDIPVSSFVRIVDTDVANAIFFSDKDIIDETGITAGDFITITGSTNNDVVDAVVIGTGENEQGTWVIVNQAMALETNTAGTMSIRSRYDTLSFGLGLNTDEVDVAQFVQLMTFYASQIPEMDFYCKDTLDGKKFIDEQLFFPMGAYSLPRKGRVSVGFTAPPLATDKLLFLDATNVTSPDKLRLRRTTAKNFYNTVVYQFNPDIDSSKYLGGHVTVDEDSKNRIRVGTKSLKITSDGLRPGDDQRRIMRINALRMLDRYKFAAESFEMNCFYGDGFNVEVGDVVMFGDPELQTPDTKLGSKAFEPRLCEVLNKSMDIKTGSVKVTLVDTNYLADGRFGIISPSSKITSVTQDGVTMRVKIQDSYSQPLPYIEKDKFINYVGSTILIHSPDWSFEAETTFNGFADDDNYTMICGAVVGATAGMIIDIPQYDSAETVYKSQHCFFSPSIPVIMGIDQSSFQVFAGNATKLFPECTILLRDDNWNVTSEYKVLSVVGDVVTIDGDFGFIPSPLYTVEMVGFVIDEGYAYRYI